ncbi:hypothetical protein [Gemmobacter caeruleus]|uniref:hypothetical protein n=1 Tax=Gemmobacter caeruleus TaxID=2595004 RepID=UPI0011EF0896|nr:hypothetical protein [Gemmobacter caeruleus]
MSTKIPGPDPPGEGPAAAFLRAARAAQPEYFARMRGRVARLEINEAERFARAFLRDQVTGPQAPLAGAEEAILEAIEAAPRVPGLGLVAAALLAIGRQDWARAARLAERAYAGDQHETFAQRLFLAAEERSASLRLGVDDWLQDRFCPAPFTDLEIIGNADLYTCCAAWLPAPIGNARRDDPLSAWQGAAARELRRSVLEGDFGHCSRLSCPYIARRSLPRRDEVKDPALRAVIDGTAPVPEAPRRVLLSYDTSCNLSCPSCRSALIAKSQAEVRDLDAFYDARVAPLLAGATAIKVTGSGDPFGSRHFRRVLGKLTTAPPVPGQPRLQLHTNGVLFDPRAWERLRLEGHVRSVWVSVDATEAETYAILRRDGDFVRLQRNLDFLGGLRRDGRIGQLRLDFVVQARNFRQMPALVAQARRIGADGVHFLMLRNWGTFTQADYLAEAVAQEGHPEHAELLRLLADPVFGAPDVDLGNLAPLRAAPPVPAVPAAALPPVLLVLGLQRSGSNLLFDALESWSDLMVLREVFNPRAAYGADDALVAHLAGWMGHDLLGPADHRLVRRLRGDPGGALVQLRRAAAARGAAAVAIKVFPGHVPEAVLAAWLADPAIQPVLLHRPLLDCWISWQKARRTERWANTDTTGQRIEADPAAFLDWAQGMQEWQDGLRAARGDLPLAEIDYDRDLAPGPGSMRDAILRALADSALVLAPPGPFHLRHRRQDRSTDPLARLSNPEAFRAALRDAARFP